MKDIKDILKILFMFCIVLFVYIYRSNISNFITDNIIYGQNNKVLSYNEYYLEYDYSYVQNTDSTKVKSNKDILNIIYTFLNSGDDNFSFYCDYDNCINDVKDFIKNENEIGNINNFVHPYNSFEAINIDITSSGKITVKNRKVYSDYQISYINDYINNFINSNINESMSNYEKIQLFHDYIIEHTIYDKNNSSNSYTAYNLITTGKSICGGYSDIMSIYLHALGIKNYKITSENHIWNLVYLDGKWYHLDMTWDDPVASDGNQYLLHNFFMISTNELFKLDNVEHNFDKNIYAEAN